MNEITPTQPEPIVRGEWLGERGLTLPSGLSFERWLAVGDQLRRLEKGVQFWLGDWLNYGEKAYGEKYAQAVLETGHSEGSLANYSYVARSVEPSRRRENVAFGHYQNIAPLLPEQQEAFLDRIENERLTVAESRQLVKTQGQSVKPKSMLERAKALERIIKLANKVAPLPSPAQQALATYEREFGWLD